MRSSFVLALAGGRKNGSQLLREQNSDRLWKGLTFTVQTEKQPLSIWYPDPDANKQFKWKDFIIRKI